MPRKVSRKKYIRAEKTTKNRDDYKVLMAGIIAAVLLMVMTLKYDRLQEKRWFRDITKLTPFYNVSLEYSQVNGDTIMVGGFLIKRRCDFRSMIGYVIGEDGIRRPMIVEPTPEVMATDAYRTRPPSTEKETWGPWLMKNTWDVSPIYFQIYIDHHKCPTPPEQQTNLFISGAWENFTKE